MTDWLPVRRDNLISINWKETPLQIRLKQFTLEEDQNTLEVRFKAMNNADAGSVTVHFTSSSVKSYQIGWCSAEIEVKDFNVEETIGEGTICTVSRTESGVLIECKDLEIVNFVLSDENCKAEKSWFTYWREDAIKFRVPSHQNDNVSGFYREKPGEVVKMLKVKFIRIRIRTLLQSFKE